MDCSRDDKLVTRSYPENGGQWLSVQMEISDKRGAPPGPVQGPLIFNIFINDFNSGIGCTLSKFADDTKLCSAVNMPKGQDTIQRDLDRLQLWVQENLMRFSKAKCKVLHLGCGNSNYQYKLG